MVNTEPLTMALRIRTPLQDDRLNHLATQRTSITKNKDEKVNMFNVKSEDP